MASHALKGVAETCCAANLADACFQLENFAARLTGYHGVRTDGSSAADLMEADFEPAALHLLPRIERCAATVLENISFLEGLPPDLLVAQLATAGGYPEQVVCTTEVRQLLTKRQSCQLILLEPSAARAFR